MMSGIKAQTDSALRQFNQQFERSKSELIGRFLQDQQELNKKFEEYAFNEDDGSSAGGGRGREQARRASNTNLQQGKSTKLKLVELDSDADSNSSLDSIVTNPDLSDSDREEAIRPQPRPAPQPAPPPKQNPGKNAHAESKAQILRRVPRHEQAFVTNLPFEKSTTSSKPWLNRSRGNPERRLPQAPPAEVRPKPWSLKARSKPAEDGVGIHDKRLHSESARMHEKSSSVYSRDLQDEPVQAAQNQRQSQLQSSSLGRSKSLRYPDRAYTPTQDVMEGSKQPGPRQADSGFESNGSSSRSTSQDRPKKLLVKRSVRPNTAMGLRNHERLKDASGGRFIDTDQSRSAPGAARNIQLVSNASDCGYDMDSASELHRSNSIRSESAYSSHPRGVGGSGLRHVTNPDMYTYPRQSRSSSVSSAMRSAEPGQSLLHRTRSTEVINAGLSTTDMNRKYRRSRGYHDPTQAEETTLKKAVSCGNFHASSMLPGQKVTVLKLPKISAANSTPNRKSLADRSGTSFGYYTKNETVV